MKIFEKLKQLQTTANNCKHKVTIDFDEQVGATSYITHQFCVRCHKTRDIYWSSNCVVEEEWK